MKIFGNINNVSFRANKMPKKQAEYFNKKLLSSTSTDIFCHTTTDEDAFNSAKIMYEYLTSKGIKTRIICNNAENNYGYDENKYDIIDFNKNNQKIQRAQTALCIDFSEPIRIRGNALDYLNTFNSEDILCIDHHNPNPPIIKNNQVTKSLKQAPHFKSPQNGYVDSTAKSAASILVRFFQALNIKMTPSQNESAFCAMTDDLNKEKYIDIVNGKIEKSDDFKSDLNAIEVYETVQNAINPKKQDEIIKHLDILSRLTPEEKNFRDTLYKNIHITPNKKFAYIIIPPDDSSWENIGGDNNVTSKILRDTRTRILEHERTDEYIPQDLDVKLQDVQAIAIFYPDLKTGKYKMSMHTNKDYALKIIDYVRNNYYSAVKAGGHPNRAGGSTQTLDLEKCKKWIENFIKAGECFSYN